MSSGSGTMLKPLGFMARIDKLGMRAITITKSFFMFVFMIVLILRLTHKYTLLMGSGQVLERVILVKMIDYRKPCAEMFGEVIIMHEGALSGV